MLFKPALVLLVFYKTSENFEYVNFVWTPNKDRDSESVYYGLQFKFILW